MNQDRQRQIRVLEIFFLVVLVAFTVAIYRVMAPFLLDILVAVLLTSIFYRMFRFIRRPFKRVPVVASLLTVLAVLVLVAVPVAVVSLLVYSEVSGAIVGISENLPDMDQRLGDLVFVQALAKLPVLSEYVQPFVNLELDELFGTVGRQTSEFVLSIAQQSLGSVSASLFHAIIVLFLMVFLFLDGPRMLHRIYDTLPVSNTELDELTREAVNTTAATLISTVIIGLIEGTFGALLFMIFGLPSPFLWGVVILILSMIPMIGTNLVLAPAGIILALSGRFFSGLVLVALGLAAVSFTQNVLKPKLLGDRAGLHPAVVLLATLGGIAWLGLIGFLIGPLLASLFIVVWRQFGKRYQHELSMKNRQHEPYEHGGGGDVGGQEPNGRGAPLAAAEDGGSARLGNAEGAEGGEDGLKRDESEP